MDEHRAKSKREFQLERIILFTDAVFAIAITLLVLEIKVPGLHGPDVTEGAILRALFALLPKFVGFLVSFTLIGMYWTVHHRMFGFVRDYTPRLLILNLIFLLTVVLMPFSTGMFGEYSTPRGLHLKTPLIIYVVNICCTGLVNFLLWAYVCNPANGVTDSDLDRTELKAAKMRAAIVPSVFALVVPAAFISPFAARYVPLVIPLVVRIAGRRARRKAPPFAARSAPPK